MWMMCVDGVCLWMTCVDGVCVCMCICRRGGRNMEGKREEGFESRGQQAEI